MVEKNSENRARGKRSDKSDSDQNRLIVALFVVITEAGWAQVTMRRVAEQSGLPLHRCAELASNRYDVLRLFARKLDQAMLAAPLPNEGSVRDRCFDLLMRRLDAARPCRDGLLALRRSAAGHPGLVNHVACSLHHSMRWLVEAAEYDADSRFYAKLLPTALVGIWLSMLRRWQDDDSPDAMGVMAGLDRDLARIARLFGRDAPRPAPEPNDVA